MGDGDDGGGDGMGGGHTIGLQTPVSIRAAWGCREEEACDAIAR